MPASWWVKELLAEFEHLLGFLVAFGFVGVLCYFYGLEKGYDMGRNEKNKP